MSTKAPRQRVLYRLFAGGIPLTALLTAVFYLQGKAYQAGYLRYFHIDSSQMTITTADAMWNAYRGWTSGAATILLQSGSLFFDSIWHLGPPALIFGTLATIGFMLLKNVRRRAPGESGRPPAAQEYGVRKKILLILAFVGGYIFSIPAAIVLASLLVVLTVSVTVEPFFKTGERDAAEICEIPAAVFPTIPNLMGLSKENGLIHQLWCSTDTCAIIQSGTVHVVQKSLIPITTGAPLSLDLKKIQSGPYQTLCTKETPM